MVVYIDNMHTTALGRYGSMRMSHMIADTTEELLAMADRIGVSRRWIQKAGTPREHFDIGLTARRKAVAAGAVEISMRELVVRIRTRQNSATAPPRSGA